MPDCRLSVTPHQLPKEHKITEELYSIFDCLDRCRLWIHQTFVSFSFSLQQSHFQFPSFTSLTFTRELNNGRDITFVGVVQMSAVTTILSTVIVWLKTLVSKDREEGRLWFSTAPFYASPYSLWWWKQQLPVSDPYALTNSRYLFLNCCCWQEGTAMLRQSWRDASSFCWSSHLFSMKVRRPFPGNSFIKSICEKAFCISNSSGTDVASPVTNRIVYKAFLPLCFPWQSTLQP